MEVKLEDFVGETLKQIIGGVKNAQEKAKDVKATISPDSHLNYDKKDCLFYAGRLVEHVDFDVAVTCTEQKEAKGGFGIFVAALGAGAQGKTATSSSTITRIKFSVPVVFPDQA